MLFTLILNTNPSSEIVLWFFFPPACELSMHFLIGDLKKNWNIVDLHYHVSFRCTAEWFSYVNGVFWWKGNFDFDENQFISFFPCMFGAFVTWKKSSPTPRSRRFSPIFSSRRCWGLCLCPWPIQDLFLCRTRSWVSIFFRIISSCPSAIF